MARGDLISEIIGQSDHLDGPDLRLAHLRITPPVEGPGPQGPGHQTGVIAS
jgi:hypothetical protein